VKILLPRSFRESQQSAHGNSSFLLGGTGYDIIFSYFDIFGIFGPDGLIFPDGGSTFKEVTIKNPNFNTESSCKYNKKSRRFDINCGVNWDLVNQTVEIYLNNELINKDIKHNLLTNLIICAHMQKEISKAEYLAGREHSPNEYFSEIIGGKLTFVKIEKFIIIQKLANMFNQWQKLNNG